MHGKIKEKDGIFKENKVLLKIYQLKCIYPNGSNKKVYQSKVRDTYLILSSMLV